MTSSLILALSSDEEKHDAIKYYLGVHGLKINPYSLTKCHNLTIYYKKIIKRKNNKMLMIFLEYDLGYSFDNVFETALSYFEPDIIKTLILYNNHKISYYDKFINNQPYNTSSIRYYFRKYIYERNKILNYIERYNENINEGLYYLPLSLTNIICDYVNISICEVLVMHNY